MAQHLKIVQMLEEEDWLPFHLLIGSRRTTIDGARAWLRKKGYRISRTAVGKYMQRRRSRLAEKPLAAIRAVDEGRLRQRVQESAERLEGNELASLAMFAAFLLNAPSKRAAKRFRQRVSTRSTRV